uniref:Uncharacterized protein n=1 Tax=Utricularia reniformis TaxID=192314 RepID=A0A1Y0B116_9LAMI|nr:hypothetical protein AEK19_MT0919 [Utricularia reniformis]ART31145.1 hypothetical protein AEK19_MT0919 [Utricularia reniformis]
MFGFIHRLKNRSLLRLFRNLRLTRSLRLHCLLYPHLFNGASRAPFNLDRGAMLIALRIDGIETV